MRQFKFKHLVLPLAVLCAFLGPIHAVAQSDSDRVREALERREEERLREQKRAAEQVPSQLTQPTTLSTIQDLPVETPCFTIRDVVLKSEGSTQFSSFADRVRPLIGKCLGTKGLASVVSLLDESFIQSGHVTTRAALPPQNLSEGTLQVIVQAGLIGDVQLKDAPTGSSWGTWKNAFPISIGKVLNIRDLEQGVEQMQRLPSQRVTTKIEPGTEPGTSTVVIERTQPPLLDRLHGGITLDNSAIGNKGNTNASFNAALDNPSGLNDLLNVSLNTPARRTTEQDKSQSVSLFYSIPWNYQLFSLSQTSSEFAQTVQGTTARFVSSGSSQTFEAKWTTTVWRTASIKTGGYLAASTRSARSYLDDVELIVQARRLSNIEVGLQHKQLWGNASVDLELSHRQPSDFDQAQEDLTTAKSGGPTLKPKITQLVIDVNSPVPWLGKTTRYSGRFRLQATTDLTLAADQFSIGSRGTVRGFDGESVLQAEEGWTLRNEFSFDTTLGSAWGLQVSPYLALDIGRVSGPSTALLPGDQLVGAALGVRARRQALSLDASVATPISQPEGFKSQRLNTYLSANWSF